MHGQKWCLSVMDKMSFEVKKYAGNALPIMRVPQEILTYQAVKKLNL